MTDPALDDLVTAFVAAVNANDETAFRAVLAPRATMSDDGRDRDVGEWARSEIFSSHARMAIEQVTGPGDFIATYTNDTWGAMRTRWHFEVSDGRITRFETGQA